MISKYATLHELQTIYDVSDLFDFHDAIDIELELEEANAPKTGKR